MNRLLTFSFIGGDLRQLRVISILQEMGYKIRVFGIDSKGLSDSIYRASSLKDCVADCDVVCLPLPYTRDGQNINCDLTKEKIGTEDLKDAIPYGKTVLAGKTDSIISDICKEKNARLVDYADREEMAVMNAVPTAEGAIEIAMNNTTHTINGSRCLVTGYGKIGKVLSGYLKALGAEVVASARKCKDIALIKAMGIRAVKTEELRNSELDFDIIFNTIPAVVFDFEVLAKTKKDVLIIDLASAPGGVDFEMAKSLNRKAIWALSLPGKVAPDTAGEIVADTIINVLEEMGV